MISVVDATGCFPMTEGQPPSQKRAQRKKWPDDRVIRKYAAAFKKADVTANQLRDLTEIALKIANRLLVARGLGEYFVNPLAREHAEAMLNAPKESAHHLRAFDQSSGPCRKVVYSRRRRTESDPDAYRRAASRA